GPPGKPGTDMTERVILGSESGPLYLANCKLVVKPYGNTRAIEGASVPRGQLRNCLIVSPWVGMHLYYSSGTQWTVDNCLIAAAQVAQWGHENNNAPGAKFKLTRNTLVANHHVGVLIEDALAEKLRDKAGKPVPPAFIEMEQNICKVGSMFHMDSVTAKSPQGLPIEEQRAALAKLFHWKEHANVYGSGAESFLYLHSSASGLLKDLAEWNKY